MVDQRDLLLPRFEDDSAFVLLARRRLREQTPPMSRVGLNIDHSLPWDSSDTIVREDRLDRPLHLVDDAGVSGAARDDQPVDTASTVQIDPAIAQILAE